jgi:hypothetical protein
VILGYPERPSAVAGEAMVFHVSTDAPAFRVELHRQGAALACLARSSWFAAGVRDLLPGARDGAPRAADRGLARQGVEAGDGRDGDVGGRAAHAAARHHLEPLRGEGVRRLGEGSVGDLVDGRQHGAAT